MQKMSYYLKPFFIGKPRNSISVYTDDQTLRDIAERFEGVSFVEEFERSGMIRLNISPLYDENEVLTALENALSMATLGDVWRDALPDDD